MDVELFDPRGYGLIKGNYNKIYGMAKDAGKKIAIVRETSYNDKKGELVKIFNQIQTTMDIVEFEPEKIYDPKEVLDFYLLICNLIPKKDLESNLESLRKRPFVFADVVFVELGVYLSSKVEYLIMIYNYLMHNGFSLSEFYVIVDYETSQFDFIENTIFRKDWAPEYIKPVPNYFSVEYKNENYENFDRNIYSSLFQATKLQFIVSENNTLCETISSDERGYAIFETYEQYIKSGIKITSLVKFRNLDEIIKLSTINADLIIIDPKMKIHSDLHYGGNVPQSRRMSDDYFNNRIQKIKARNQGDIRFMIYHCVNFPKEMKESPRGIFERSPIIDYIYFSKYGVNLLNLYSRYISASGISSFINILKYEINTLEYLGYNENPKLFDICIDTQIHPMMIAIINKWFEEKDRSGDPFPKFPILLFVAVSTMFKKQGPEVKEHGDRVRDSDIAETSTYGIEMKKYMDLLLENKTAVFPAGEKTSNRLKRLIDNYKINSSQIGYFNINDFTKFLVYLLETHFDRYILTKKSYSNYKGCTNEQLNWTISQSSGPSKIFPIIVHNAKQYRNVTFYIPIETS